LHTEDGEVRKVSIHDVARHAGVSQPTVSKVINGYPNLKPSTRQKVLAAIEELGFRPDAIARSMVKNRTFTIGLIVGDIANPFYAETGKEIVRRAHEAGYEVVMLDTDYDDGERFDACVETLLAKRVDGILASSVSRDNAKVKALHESGYPVVLFNRNVDDRSVPSVELDNERGARLALEHLASLGHRRVAYVSGPLRYSTFHDRHRGFAAGAASLGLSYEPDDVLEGAFAYEEVRRFAERRLSGERPPTGFLVSSDQMAIAVLDAASRLGLAVPGDVSVVGFDNIDISGNPFISLTTVSQQKKRMSMLALERLIERIEGRTEEAAPLRTVLEPELVVRNTTGPARGREET